MVALNCNKSWGSLFRLFSYISIGQAGRHQFQDGIPRLYLAVLPLRRFRSFECDAKMIMYGS
jgi:hypothetical protein